MKAVGLFAGIAGLETGLARAGHETTLACEILPPARAVLEARLPGVELRGDVRELRSLPAGTEILCGGFPCQDLSQAGEARGLDGERSGLVNEVFRLAKRSRPEWVLLENVPFMLQLRGGEAMRRIVDALDELGYRWAWRVVDSFGFALPQRRERVFLLASRSHSPEDVLFVDDNPLLRPTTRIGELAHGFYWTEGRGGLGWAVDAVPTLKNGSGIGIPSPPAILLPDGTVVKPDIRDAERLQGFDAGWTEPAEAAGRRSSRWSLVGSAISVPVAEWLGRRLMHPGTYTANEEKPFPSAGSLPRAARGDKKGRRAVAVSADPLGLRAPPLATFLKYEPELLSLRATAGFLSRTQVATLRFADGFIPAIERHLARMAGPQSAPKRVA
jgi:DNA (cytosine-5)-methyltransferase 1